MPIWGSASLVSIMECYSPGYLTYRDPSALQPSDRSPLLEVNVTKFSDIEVLLDVHPEGFAAVVKSGEASNRTCSISGGDALHFR